MSSSSSNYSSSSSSSMPITFTEQLNQIIAGQNPENLVLFTFTPNSGFEYLDDQQILFKFKTENENFLEYSSLLNPTTPSAIESASNCYVPEDDDINIHHSPKFYVDLIIKNSGAKNISARSQEEKYKEESVKYSFVMPRFTWDTDLRVDAISSNVSYMPLEDSIGSFWAGTSDSKIHKIEYTANVASEAFSSDIGGDIKNILVNKDGDQMYISTDKEIKKQTVGHSLDDASQLQLFITDDVSLSSKTKIMSYHGDQIWTALPELGVLQKLNLDTLVNEEEITGFDAPFKVVKSKFHNAFFIAGTNVLWKYDGAVSAVYSIEGYDIFDFDISDNGLIMISFNGPNDGYLRILDRNLFRLIKNEKITNGQAKFCKFCENNFFYGISEVDVGGDQFTVNNHIYNTLNGDYNIVESPSVIFRYVAPVAPTAATSPINIEYPNDNENVILGEDVDILWKSDKSSNDSVKIELYKAGENLKTIVDSTPNTGVFTWSVSSVLELSSDYKIKITWIANEVNSANEDISDNYFSILDEFPTSSEIDFLGSIGVDYDKLNNQIVVVLQSGLVGFLSFEDLIFTGWVDSGIIDYTSMVVKNEIIKEIGTVSKVRIFVGSNPYLSDKWDSGVVETALDCIYYGGGDNLVPGETYYVNIQVYSSDSGWSEIQTKKWIMPKK